jgi:mono/diheme cytochrome c family protein
LNTPVITKFDSTQQAALGIIITVVLSLLAIIAVYQFRQIDPYIRSVLAIHGDAIQGNAIFQMNCAGCHGTYADGRVGPSLKDVSSRKSKARLIEQVISGKTPPMPQFQPSPQEMADLLSYLERL